MRQERERVAWFGRIESDPLGLGEKKRLGEVTKTTWRGVLASHGCDVSKKDTMSVPSTSSLSYLPQSLFLTSPKPKESASSS